MYALTIDIEDEFLQRIKNFKTPQEARDTFTTIFTNKNDAILQSFENELLSIFQRNMKINQYFSKNEDNRCSLPKAIVQRDNYSHTRLVYKTNFI
ncbi:hypothetical protein H5410_021551 [Solanum commersonii]|uniref:Uncharacterized protein n=1 Tax=Solanum commersonii TaxID=4109 RepID=A0A9J5ZHI9_SOLCO|nr:hypothetical protein H5410_021551 [Solanum commersonii]